MQTMNIFATNNLYAFHGARKGIKESVFDFQAISNDIRQTCIAFYGMLSSR